MPYRFCQNETVAAGGQRIVEEQIDKAVREVDDPEIESHETVHQVRKRCKKIRAAIRLLRGELADDSTYSVEQGRYRDAARRLASLRDVEALLEAYDKLTDHYGDSIDRRRLGLMRRRLTMRRKKTAEETGELQARLADFRAAMLEGRSTVPSWPIRPVGFDALAPGLRRTYRRARKAMFRAYEERTDDAFHEWRKRVKYHWCHMRLLRDAWKPVLATRARVVRDLGTCLGDDHDLAVMRQTLTEEPAAFQPEDARIALVELIDRRRVELQASAAPLGWRLFSDNPKSFVRRAQAYWQAWQAESCDQPIAGLDL